VLRTRALRVARLVELAPRPGNGHARVLPVAPLRPQFRAVGTGALDKFKAGSAPAARVPGSPVGFGPLQPRRRPQETWTQMIGRYKREREREKEREGGGAKAR
jgi:hypothetical protein